MKGDCLLIFFFFLSVYTELFVSTGQTLKDNIAHGRQVQSGLCFIRNTLTYTKKNYI